MKSGLHFWNLNLQFALAAIELDEQTKFSANSASLNGSESGEPGGAEA